MVKIRSLKKNVSNYQTTLGVYRITRGQCRQRHHKQRRNTRHVRERTSHRRAEENWGGGIRWSKSGRNPLGTTNRRNRRQPFERFLQRPRLYFHHAIGKYFWWTYARKWPKKGFPDRLAAGASDYISRSLLFDLRLSSRFPEAAAVIGGRRWSKRRRNPLGTTNRRNRRQPFERFLQRPRLYFHHAIGTYFWWALRTKMTQKRGSPIGWRRARVIIFSARSYSISDCLRGSRWIIFKVLLCVRNVG